MVILCVYEVHSTGLRVCEPCRATVGAVAAFFCSETSSERTCEFRNRVLNQETNSRDLSNGDGLVFPLYACGVVVSKCACTLVCEPASYLRSKSSRAHTLCDHCFIQRAYIADPGNHVESERWGKQRRRRPSG